VRKIESPSAMRNLGIELAKQLKAGDLIVLSGDLGAGKTALTQGIGAGLGFADITSPTFVISRVHKGALPLIHIDAYRLLDKERGAFEFDDLDIDTEMKDAVTVIEWGDQFAPRLSDQYLLLKIEFGEHESERLITAIGHGARWEGFSL
jgi:tRNA threonylcarbamoyladenosine biosynthesis protein TsaE